MRQLERHISAIEQFNERRGDKMKFIIEEVYERVFNGERFNIDFEKRNLRLGKQYIVKDGHYDVNEYILLDTDTDLRTILHEIEELYQKYKYSTPSERSENKHRNYFKALPIEELTDEQLILGEAREVAQAILESYILCRIISGALYWDEEIMGRWFYQGEDPDLIILKSWIKEREEK